MKKFIIIIFASFFLSHSFFFTKSIEELAHEFIVALGLLQNTLKDAAEKKIIENISAKITAIKEGSGKNIYPNPTKNEEMALGLYRKLKVAVDIGNELIIALDGLHEKIDDTYQESTAAFSNSRGKGIQKNIEIYNERIPSAIFHLGEALIAIMLDQGVQYSTIKKIITKLNNIYQINIVLEPEEEYKKLKKNKIFFSSSLDVGQLGTFLASLGEDLKGIASPRKQVVTKILFPSVTLETKRSSLSAENTIVPPQINQDEKVVRWTLKQKIALGLLSVGTAVLIWKLWKHGGPLRAEISRRCYAALQGAEGQFQRLANWVSYRYRFFRRGR